MDLSSNTATSNSFPKTKLSSDANLSRSSSSVSASTLSALNVAALRSRRYPYSSPSYDPLIAAGRGVENVLHKRLSYEEGRDMVYCFEVRNGKGRPLSLTPEGLVNPPEVLLMFPLWRTIPTEKIFISDYFFQDILTHCDVNPLFVQNLSLSGVGAADHCMTRDDTALHSSFHVCIRYPHTYPELECALYLGYSYTTKQTNILFLEGHGTVISRVGHVLEELSESKYVMPQHPFAYLVPFVRELGRAIDYLRSKEKENVIWVEKSTDTGEVDPFQIGGRNIENITHLTRLAHLRSAGTARLQKLTKFHVRAVHEVITAFKKYQAYQTLSDQASKLHTIESDRIATSLDQELDLCEGRTMETDNLVKRTDLQINVLFSLAAQKDSQINKRIAEESKRIAADTKRDSESMKTIAVLTMVFLPGTFVSAVLGMNFFDATPTGRFVVARSWWIFPAVAVPLTLLVLLCWSAWIFWKRRISSSLSSSSSRLRRFHDDHDDDAAAKSVIKNRVEDHDEDGLRILT